MPSLPTLRECGLPAEVIEIPAKASMEGGLDVRARGLNDSLCCLTKDAAVQLHRKCSITSGSPLFRNGRHPIVIQGKMSALHVATSHFYHDSYLTLSLPRLSIDDLVFSVFTSIFLKLSYKISLIKN